MLHDYVLMDQAPADGGAPAAGGGAPAAPAAPAAGKPADGGAPPAPAAPAAGAPAAPAAGAKPADGAPAGGEPKGYWPDNWLERVSKGDEKAAKQLGRYASPEALAEAHLQLRRRMDSGEFKAALPKNPTEADLKAWRKDNGIPEKHTDYDLKGIEIPESDRPIVDSFLKDVAHAQNMTVSQARAALNSFYQIQKHNEDARAAQDEQERGKAIDSLSSEWGANTTRNKTLIGNAINRFFPEAVREKVKSARLSDGTLLFNSPEVLRGFLAAELEVNPTGIVAHAGGGEIGKSMVERYNEIQKVMTENRAAYNKDEAMQKEQRELINALMKHGLMDSKGNLKKAA